MAGEPAEKVLTGWARSSRFAGSKDRAAIRDHVFDALRRRRSLAATGGALSGRGLILGLLRAAGTDPAAVFTGQGHAPAPLSAAEAAEGRPPRAGAEAADCPDWLWDLSGAAQDAAIRAAWEIQRDAAPAGIRVHLGRIPREALAARLEAQGIATRPDPRSPSALVAPGRPRGLVQTAEYHDGLFEMQDPGSQWVADQVPLEPGQSLLDYCAGGGGKVLAVAARVAGEFHAHDGLPRRMADLPARAARAGTPVALHQPGGRLPVCDTVLADVPCSGSGTWRRAPDAKWRLTPQDLEETIALQAQILDRAAQLVRPGGYLVQATCSLLRGENEDQAEAFLARHPDFAAQSACTRLPDALADGYFVSVFRRTA
nr:RsmB/NOP family class I SAM-dependent RNA methyltransferase [Mangrovicoccus algicola]